MAARERGYARVGLRTRVVFRAAIALYEAEGYARATGSAGGAVEGGDLVFYRAL